MDTFNLNARFRPISTWPGPRTTKPVASRFAAPWSDTIELLKRELRQLGARNVVVEMDLPEGKIRNDGLPYANATPRSPGVILSMETKHGPLRYPCDQFTSWRCNFRAIALALEALRKVDRYGVTRHGEQYRGWKQLPAGGSAVTTLTAEKAARILADAAYRGGRFPNHPYGAAERALSDAEFARTMYRAAARATHPDHDGVREEFDSVQAAWEVLSRHHGGA